MASLFHLCKYSLDLDVCVWYVPCFYFLIYHSLFTSLIPSHYPNSARSPFTDPLTPPSSCKTTPAASSDLPPPLSTEMPSEGGRSKAGTIACLTILAIVVAFAIAIALVFWLKKRRARAAYVEMLPFQTLARRQAEEDETGL